jgi:hypothetical protein
MLNTQTLSSQMQQALLRQCSSDERCQIASATIPIAPLRDFSKGPWRELRDKSLTDLTIAVCLRDYCNFDHIYGVYYKYI